MLGVYGWVLMLGVYAWGWDVEAFFLQILGEFSQKVRWSSKVLLRRLCNPLPNRPQTFKEKTPP